MSKKTKSSSTTKANEPKKSVTGSAVKDAAANGSPPDAEALLSADHRKVKTLFAKILQLEDPEERSAVVKEICTELMIHTALEEEVFYPACREKDVEDDALEEAQVEHDGTKILIVELLAAQPGDRFYDAKVKVLSESVKHHVSEEEKGDGIFAKAREKGVDMNAIGQRMSERKQELISTAQADRLSPSPLRALQSTMFHTKPNQEEDGMNRQMSGRDENGRFTSDDDNERGGQRRQTQGRYRDDDDRYSRGRDSEGRSRDEDGRFGSDRGDQRNGGRNQQSQSRERDENGRFMSDDDRRSDSRSEGRGQQSRERDEDGRFMAEDDRRGQGGRSGRHDDDDRRFSSGRERDGYSEDRSGSRGRFGGESDDDRRSPSRGRSSDDDRQMSRSGGSNSRSRDDDDDDRRRMSSRSGGSSSSRSRDDDDDGRGWHGDSAGHSEAARKGWEHRESQSRSQSGSSRSRSRDDDHDRRSSSRSSGGSSGQGHGGWFGDSRGHADAARRGWENR